MGQLIDNALDVIEADNPRLKGADFMEDVANKKMNLVGGLEDERPCSSEAAQTCVSSIA